MEDVKEVKLPSGAILKISLISIDRADALNDAVMEELKTISAETKLEALKNSMCSLYSSQKVKKAIERCWEQCLYDGKRITLDTFEPRVARQDLPIVRMEVAREALEPFLKSLFAALSPLVETAGSTPQ